MSFPQLNFTQVRNELARTLLRYDHRKLVGFCRERHDRAKGDRDGGMRNLSKSDRSYHAWPQMTVTIAYGHLNSKDSVLYVGRWGDACNPPLQMRCIILLLQCQFLSQTYSAQNII